MIHAELILVNGESRSIALPDHTGSIANALGRLDDWIRTEDGAWVQKSFIVEVRAVDRNPATGGWEELERLSDASDAAGSLADQANGSHVT
jgi:hypothetical protein